MHLSSFLLHPPSLCFGLSSSLAGASKPHIHRGLPPPARCPSHLPPTLSTYTVDLASLHYRYIFVRYPNLDGESITQITNHLASNEIVALAARNVGYQHLLRCRQAAVVKTDHPDSKRIIAESFSAFVGALLVDQGSDAASNFALDMMVPVLESTDVTTYTKLHVEPQRTLWTVLHREGSDAPTYTVLKETGRQSHAPMFLVGVFVGDEKLAEGASVSLKDAKKEAAKAALRMRYSQELGPNTELPTAWGEFSVGEVKDYIGDTQDP